MNNIFDKICNDIVKHNMLSENDKVLIGVSGGADSVFLTIALIHLKEQFNITLGVAHINHGIRGNDADKDQEFVKIFCERNSLPYYTVNLDIPSIAKSTKSSEETAGRRERYNFFKQICQDYGYNKIAVAHNMNDSVETMLINIIRGSGLKGMCGIQPVNGNIIRPIIGISRTEIENYLDSNKINYCTDETNYSGVYTRNKVRNKIIPLMQEINPTLIQTVYSNFENLIEENKFLEEVANKSNCISTTNGTVQIDKSTFSKLDITIKKRVIFKAFSLINGNCNNIESKHIDILLKNLPCGKILHMPNGITVESCYDCIAFSKDYSDKDISFCIDVELNNTIVSNEFFAFKLTLTDSIDESDYNSLYIDANKLSGKRITVRNRKDGDKIKLLGMNGQKKLKQLMSELKIKASLRNIVPLLCADDDIVAVIPHRISEDYKVTDETTRILKIQTIKEK